MPLNIWIGTATTRKKKARNCSAVKTTATTKPIITGIVQDFNKKIAISERVGWRVRLYQIHTVAQHPSISSQPFLLRWVACFLKPQATEQVDFEPPLRKVRHREQTEDERCSCAGRECALAHERRSFMRGADWI